MKDNDYIQIIDLKDMGARVDQIWEALVGVSNYQAVYMLQEVQFELQMRMYIDKVKGKIDEM